LLAAEPELGDKYAAPEVGPNWDDIQRWSELGRWSWTDEEHINILEARSAVQGLDVAASRDSEMKNLRVLAMVDSQVSLGVLAKGRSSRRALNRIARKFAALSFTRNLTVIWRYIRTHRNHADGPSRGERLGYLCPGGEVVHAVERERIRHDSPPSATDGEARVPGPSTRLTKAGRERRRAGLAAAGCLPDDCSDDGPPPALCPSDDDAAETLPSGAVGRTRDQKRGPKAWQNSVGCKDLRRLELRMYAHLVGDETAASRYLRALRLWADFIEEQQFSCVTFDDLDRSLAQFQAHMCYVEDKNPCLGDQVMNGAVYLFPEAESAFRRGWRCLKVWHRVHIEGKGGPVAPEVLRVMEEVLRSDGDFDSADMMSLAVDCYLREQDMEGLRWDDVVATHDVVVLKLGRSSRGESSKTGRDQGVIIDAEEVAQMMRQRRMKAEEKYGMEKFRGKRVFGVSSVRYRQSWWTAATKLGVTVGPPHSARHTGASRDAFEGYRSLAQIQRRGRWTSDRSVVRYSRTHDFASAYEGVPDRVLRRGRELLATRVRPPKARD